MIRRLLHVGGHATGRALLVLIATTFVVSLVEQAWAQVIQFPPKIVSKGNTGPRTKTDSSQHPNPPGG